MSTVRDILIIGGGPAGLAAGNLLAQSGLDVLLLEGDHHPRHHIGESLLAASMPILESLNISMEEMSARFQPKHGARFYDPVTDQLATFDFELPLPPPRCTSPSYQVLREEFDTLLAAKARAAGCTIEEGTWVESVDENREQPLLQTRDGRQLSCRFLVDATGREPLLAIKRKTRTLIPDYGRVGIYNYYTDLPPHDHLDPRYITMYLFPDGWFWLIPLRDGRTSVGVVYRRIPTGVQCAPKQSREEALFHHAVRFMPRLHERLNAARATDPFRTISDYSYTVSEKFGPSWAAIGDAAGFLDPIFSSGVHLALASAQRASAAILEKLQTGSSRSLEDYAAYMQQGFHVFRAFVHRFYNRDLVNNLFFMPNKPAHIHAAITRILAGHVWDPANPVVRMLLANESTGAIPTAISA